MECTGKVASIAISYGTGKPVVALELDGDKQTLLQAIEELKAAEKLTIKVSKYSNKRSTDANAYAWTLMGKLAAKLKIPKNDIYRQFITDLGDNCDTVCVQNKAVQSLRDGWERNGIGWVTETVPSKIEGCTNVTLYYGSSTYDKAQMARLIDAIIDACREYGVETRSEEEIASLMERWKPK